MSNLYSRHLQWSAILLLVALSACGGGGSRDPVLGTTGDAARAPTVTAVSPVPNVTGVTIGTTAISLTFDEAIAPISGSSTLTVTCEAPCTNAVGSTSVDGSVATFTLAAGTTFEPSTLYTVTVTGATSTATGLPMDSPFVSQFTTGSRPTVSSVLPVNGASSVNVLGPVISANFDVPVNAISGSNFTVTCATPCVSPDGAVSLSASGLVATFALTAGTTLQPLTQYTATVSGAVSQSSGYAQAAPFVWSFTSQTRPRVTAVAPTADATGVPVNNTVINAAFTEAMAPISGSASFVLACATCVTVNPAGTVSLDANNKIATFALDAGVTLEPLKVYTATITAARSLASNLTIASPFIWSFTSGVTPDVTRPRVVSTLPLTTTPGPTTNVPVNTAVKAVFTENMNPGTITAPGTFTLTCDAPCTSPTGTVTYVVGSSTATFTPNPLVDLDAGVTYTAKITTAALDLAGNALAGNAAPLPAASDYVWTFTTDAAIPVPPEDIDVLSVAPDDSDIGVCPDATVNATFDVPSGFEMDPATIDAVTFTLAETLIPLNTVTASSVILEGLTDIATFTPQDPLVDGTQYTATIKGGTNGVKDLALPANTMPVDFTWSFTAGPATGACLASPDMGASTPFGIAATAGLVNAPTAPNTVINGDVVLDPNQTCNLVNVPNDGSFGLCAGSPPTLNGQVVTNTFPNTTASAFIKADLNAAFLAITPPDGPPAEGSLGGGSAIAAPTTLGGPVGSLPVVGVNYFTPGVYTSGAAIGISGDFTLDAQGNANAVFVFQAGSALNIAAGAVGPGPHTRILLVGGAKASNVWWQVGSSATIGTFAEFKGNVLAAFDITMETGATSCGRMMSGAWVGGSGALVFEANNVSIPGNGCPE